MYRIQYINFGITFIHVPNQLQLPTFYIIKFRFVTYFARRFKSYGQVKSVKPGRKTFGMLTQMGSVT